MLQIPDNEIHKLFLALGVDLDYIPEQKYEAFIMCLQFGAACLFLYMLCRATFKLMCSFLNWR